MSLNRPTSQHLKLRMVIKKNINQKERGRGESDKHVAEDVETTTKSGKEMHEII
jgi:hypothetical protein